jgi:hypothetical protein
MGILKRIFGTTATVAQLPAGTVTVDRQGRVVTSTVSSAVPPALLQDIGRDMLELLSESRAAQMPLAEVSLHFGSLRITARELRGGAIIFLFPQTAMYSNPTPTPARP